MTGQTQTSDALARLLADGAPGVYLVGEFLGVVDRKPREVAGVTYRNADVRLLVGAALVTVQFDTRAEAESAVAGVGDRQAIALRVFNRYGVKNGQAWQFYAGPRDRADVGQTAA